MKLFTTIPFMIGLILFTLHVSAADTVTINSATSKPAMWTVEQIKTKLAGDVTKLEYTGHDGKHTSTVVPLVSLLKAAGVMTQLEPHPAKDGKAKHAEMHYAVTVEGSDGYYAVLSLAELMPDLGNRKVWLALDVDGKSWPEKESPMKLIVPEDEKPARWVHSVRTISVVKVEAPATQPAK
jgi:hypothetical protein